MIYNKVWIPVADDWTHLTKSELRKFFSWVLETIPERVNELEVAVRSTPGYEKWTANFTPESLDALGEWFYGRVEARSRTGEEFSEIERLVPTWLDVPDYILTDVTVSIAYDVGMYLGQVLSRNHDSVRWTQHLGSKNSVDYGQPVLEGFGKAKFNPIRIAQVIAIQMTQGNQDGSRLRSIYELWRGFILPAG